MDERRWEEGAQNNPVHPLIPPNPGSDKKQRQTVDGRRVKRQTVRLWYLPLRLKPCALRPNRPPSSCPSFNLANRVQTTQQCAHDKRNQPLHGALSRNTIPANSLGLKIRATSSRRGSIDGGPLRLSPSWPSFHPPNHSSENEAMPSMAVGLPTQSED